MLAQWISPGTAARTLNVSTKRVRQLVEEGRLISVTTELGRLIDPASVEQVRTEREARAKGGAAASKVRMLKGKRAKLDTADDLIRFNAGVIHDLLDGTLDADTARVAIYGLNLQRQLIETGEPGISLKARIKRLTRRLSPGGLCDCRPAPLGDDWGEGFRQSLGLLSPDREEREAAQARQRAAAACPCERCGRARFVVMIEARANWSPMMSLPTHQDERSTP
jgi:hypothetical protein